MDYARVVKDWKSPKGVTFEIAILIGDQCIDTMTYEDECFAQEEVEKLNAALREVAVPKKAADELECCLEFLHAETDATVLAENADPMTLEGVNRHVRIALAAYRAVKGEKNG